MDSYQFHLHSRSKTLTGKSKISALPQHQSPMSFQDVLNKKVTTVSPEAIFETMKKHKNKLDKEKEIIETGDGMKEEEETEAQVVKKIKDTILSLAELERRSKGF